MAARVRPVVPVPVEAPLMSRPWAKLIRTCDPSDWSVNSTSDNPKPEVEIRAEPALDRPSKRRMLRSAWFRVVKLSWALPAVALSRKKTRVLPRAKIEPVPAELCR